MSALGSSFISAEEYLERERQAETKSEYFGGEIFAISGGTPVHALLGANAIRALGAELIGSDCSVYNSELRICVSPNGLYTYPDATVVCGELQYSDERRDTVTNPKLIVEVLSNSTRDYDRGRKFHLYRELPSLAEYLTIEQNEVHAEQWTRQPSGQWLFTETKDAGISLSFPSLSIELSMSKIYDRIVFPEKN